MARRVLFICLALTAVAVPGLASAAEPATAAAGAPTTSPSSSSSSSSSSPSAFAPVSDNAIGNTDDGSGDGEGDDALAAPVGGPVPPGAFPSTLDGPALAPGSSGASRFAVSAGVVAIAAMIGRFF